MKVDSSMATKWSDNQTYYVDGKKHKMPDNWLPLRCCICGREIGVGRVSRHKIYCIKHYREMKLDKAIKKC